MPLDIAPRIGPASVLGTAVTSILRTEPVEQTIFWLFTAGLAWVPFWYGSNDWLAWGINAMIFPGLAVIYELSLLVRRKAHPVAISFVAVPATLFVTVVLWILVQTIPLPPASFLANSIWTMAGSALGNSLQASISVNRDLTILAQMRLITAASSFWLALQLCRDVKRADLLIVALGSISTAYAVYGLIALKFGQLPWLQYIPSGDDQVRSTFINPDSYATYAAIGLIVIAGLILRLYSDGMRAAAGSRRMQFAFFLERTGGHGATLLVSGFVILTALLLTASRGGVMAVAVGLFALVVLVRARRGQRGVPFLLLAIGLGLIVVTLFAFGQGVGVKLEQGGFYDDGRFAVYKLMWRSLLNKPLLGYGYGTFYDVFPMYRDRSIAVVGTWSQAHNTYLEVLQGLGLVFGTMLIGCVVIIAMRCVKGATTRRADVIAPGIAVSVACVVATHALVDFSLQIPAIALTLMALLGAGAAQSESSRAALED